MLGHQGTAHDSPLTNWLSGQPAAPLPVTAEPGLALMPGSRLPAYCTSMGRVLLAALPPDQASARLGPGPLPARTAQTLTDPEAILGALDRIRTQGFAINDQEVELGLQSLAVPLRNAQGQVIAALNVGLGGTGPTADLTARFLARLVSVQTELRGLLS
jgi:IclR family pca regulon transcriptional regulator